jgi:hypothetical protein
MFILLIPKAIYNKFIPGGYSMMSSGSVADYSRGGGNDSSDYEMNDNSSSSSNSPEREYHH